MDGWVKLHRSITENWVWNDKPFSKGQAWIDLIIMANHKDNKFPLGDKVVTVERGSLITSEVKLMERWGWSKSKVRLFLNQLQNDGMIVKKTDHKKTTINIVNYGIYQEIETTEKPVKDHKKTTDRPLKDTNKNVKNEKNIYKDNTYSDDPELNKAILDFVEYRKKIKSPMTPRAIELLLSKLNKLSPDKATQIKIINQSILNGWKGVFPLKGESKEQAKVSNKFNQFPQRQYTGIEISELERKLINKGLE